MPVSDSPRVIQSMSVMHCGWQCQSPIDEWTRYLEQGDEQLAGSGWGSIEMQGIDYVPASLLPQ